MLNSVKPQGQITPVNFCYWLQGYLEVGNPETIDREQLKTIREHLDNVFVDFAKPATINYPLGTTVPSVMEGINVWNNGKTTEHPFLQFAEPLASC